MKKSVNQPASNAIMNRRWLVEEIRRLVELTRQADVSVQSISKKYNLDSSTLSSWRTFSRKGLLEISSQTVSTELGRSEFLPVMIHPEQKTTNLPGIIVTINITNEITLIIEAMSLNCLGLCQLLASVRP
jgi:transposase-like protein